MGVFFLFGAASFFTGGAVEFFTAHVLRFFLLGDSKCFTWSNFSPTALLMRHAPS